MTAETGERRAVLIAGPTASGKSALALAIAERCGGVVINADSMQVYRELSILTARPSAEDEARAPHRLYGHVASGDGYTVARYLDDLEKTLKDMAGRPAVIVGGTGLYFNAMTQGLSDVPPIDERVRAFWRERARTASPAALHKELAVVDPVLYGRLHPNDTQRVLRALEVADSTGRPLSEWQETRSRPLISGGPIAYIVMAPERDWLHDRIDERFRAMATGGGLDEARAFAALRLDPALPAMKAIGVPEMIAAARGELPIEEAVEAAIIATRQYAKRQETWFRNQMPDWPRVDPAASRHFLAVADDIAQRMK
ncbi:tRNA (adenosine(37)-N6)-dimethylallyltransferase MiaA [Pleomorphomonas oryzae]|uniref:tRNA (adenosine(37)-N6)-dimethylallyltransferase MiaA n=1 Tax=Pleomorphomonas oryzae TaxID=261934 RepID=UPI0004175001|nr:tRNA (adenosine(37)-N6)-dimethylallyltransferase MiaA [Pleomorphomonas oryzae]